MFKINGLKLLADIGTRFGVKKSLEALESKIGYPRRSFFRSPLLREDDEEGNKESEKPETKKTEEKPGAKADDKAADKAGDKAAGDKAGEKAKKEPEAPPKPTGVFGYTDIFEKLKLQDAQKKIVLSVHKEYRLHKLTECPEIELELNRCQALNLYHDMQTIRAMERAASGLYREKVIRGFCHLYMGQEAVAVGMKAVMRPHDTVITAYRCHGWCYLMGITPEGILSELAGRSTGVQRGKGGSMHMYTTEFYGGNGIVGAQIPLGVGIALASQYKHDCGVCVACYGDGAANQGQIFEVYNMACLWKLPIIFVCENNMYGMGTSAKRSSCSDQYYTRGDYIPGLWVDGMDVVAVYNATKFAIDYVLNNGPIVLEMHTYRYQGHSMSDPGTSYRTREEIEEVRKTQDPITLFKQALIDNGCTCEEELQLIDKDIKQVVDSAVKIAKSSPEIDISELSADVYSNNLEPIIRGIVNWNIKHKQINKGKNNP